MQAVWIIALPGPEVDGPFEARHLMGKELS